MIRNKEEIFANSLAEYIKVKKNYTQKQEAYRKAYSAWESTVESEFVKSGDITDLDKKLTEATVELDSATTIYNILAHQVLRYYVEDDN